MKTRRFFIIHEFLSDMNFTQPSIAEALCEIRFFSTKIDIEDSIAKMKRKFKEYYEPEKKIIKQYQTVIGEEGISVKETSTLCWVFKHKERNHLIQIFPDMISINELTKYPGWDIFSTDISFAWEILTKGFSISSIKSIGLRYINLIPRKSETEPLSQWLQPNRYYPDGILDSTTGFVSRSEFNIEETKRLIVTIAEAIKTNHEKGFIFDIDAIYQINELLEWNSIRKRIDSLHGILSNVFFSSIAKKYESYLRGELYEHCS